MQISKIDNAVWGSITGIPERGKVLFSRALKGSLIADSVRVRSLPYNHALLIELIDPNGIARDCIMFDKPVFQLKTGDINKDGADELLLGISKPTRFDPVMKRRLSIYYIDSVKIRPLFLSSKTINELVDFGCALKENGMIVTIEKKDSFYLIGRYRWDNFSLQFKGYEAGKYSLPESIERLHHEIIK